MLGQEGARQGRVGLRDGIEPTCLQCPESEQATGRWLRTVLITKFSEAPRDWCLSDFIDSKTKKKGQINTQDHSYRRGHRKAARFTLRTTP